MFGVVTRKEDCFARTKNNPKEDKAKERIGISEEQLDGRVWTITEYKSDRLITIQHGDYILRRQSWKPFISGKINTTPLLVANRVKKQEAANIAKDGNMSLDNAIDLFQSRYDDAIISGISDKNIKKIILFLKELKYYREYSSKQEKENIKVCAK